MHQACRSQGFLYDFSYPRGGVGLLRRRDVCTFRRVRDIGNPSLGHRKSARATGRERLAVGSCRLGLRISHYARLRYSPEPRDMPGRGDTDVQPERTPNAQRGVVGCVKWRTVAHSGDAIFLDQLLSLSIAPDIP